MLAKDHEDVKGDAGADPEDSEGDGRDTCQLYRYFLFFGEFIKIIQNFKEKVVATVPSAGP